MSELKPCPFCGGSNLEACSGAGGYIICKDCDAYGPALSGAAAEDAWNKRARVPEPPVIPCEIPGCSNEAVYEAWWRKRDPFLMTPTGHLIRIYICKAHETHPFLVANEKKT